MDSKRYTIAIAVGVVTEDEQVASNFAAQYLEVCESVAQIMAGDSAFKGKLELFPIMPGEDDEVSI